MSKGGRMRVIIIIKDYNNKKYINRDYIDLFYSSSLYNIRTTYYSWLINKYISRAT